jgi:hypothetical protein
MISTISHLFESINLEVIIITNKWLLFGNPPTLVQTKSPSKMLEPSKHYDCPIDSNSFIRFSVRSRSLARTGFK